MAPPQQPTTQTCLVPAGLYLTGPDGDLQERALKTAVQFDASPVTAARYTRFLKELRPDGTSEWDHPDQPVGVAHIPWSKRLRDLDFYSDTRWAEYPAVCVSWWSAYAFASFDGKRLPTSLEWEAAARGTDGRPFPWGSNPDPAAVNCADQWAGRPLATYEQWRDAARNGELTESRAPATDRPANRSPFGVIGMVGNAWEWTSTVIEETGDAILCGGAYDTSLHVICTSLKGTYSRRGQSNAVTFRCVQDAST
ncbi:formylglycine-generating enzyme family protein (plasmid) [Streptomyces sp. NBC_01724]|uniref:formylglycine-generating enzyme family protein n=1 Tax=Streptomyces sp. NBC_01724 TaxID=2975922 RepID=UPI002E303EE7|nr:SUMF1/EgtB/PvdO family nonheme iron enzyme [Streptomyces sp. NBC_01724]